LKNQNPVVKFALQITGSCVPEELFINIKFKNRKTGEFKDAYVRIPNLEKYANGHKRYFDIHEFRICEKRIVSKDEFEKKGKA
jgi:hypothetical protein